MNKNLDKFFSKTLCVIMMAWCAVCTNSDAAVRTAVRGNSSSRRPVVAATTTKQSVTTTETKAAEPTPEPETTVESEPEQSFDYQPIADAAPMVEAVPEEIVIENKTGQFNDTLSGANVSTGDSSVSDLAEQIRKQRAAFEAKEAAEITQRQQQEALAYGKNTCDNGLRKCMSETCGNDFSKCALDGDTMFGEKLNKCRMKTTCTGEEFRLFTTEIKADRDFNVQMASYNAVVECGNNYNKCIINECGATFGKCLGKNAADRAIKKCATVAKNCTEQDSGLASRMGLVIGKLRETAEKDVKTDEERLYKLRDLMRKQCQHLGAMFDERSFDCVYTVNFFAGENQSSPLASRKAYAGSSFVCMQEWFGINATTFKENAYRETRSQTAASSAMLGSGLGTAAGLITSGAIDRALETQAAKKDYKKECKAQGGKLKDGECVKKGDKGYNKIKPEEEDKDNTKAEARAACSEQGGKYFLGKCWGANGSDDAIKNIPGEENENENDPTSPQPPSDEEIKACKKWLCENIVIVTKTPTVQINLNVKPGTSWQPISDPASITSNWKVPMKSYGCNLDDDAFEFVPTETIEDHERDACEVKQKLEKLQQEYEKDTKL